jgi:hypothetical protein
MKTKETSTKTLIDCSNYLGQDYPRLTTNMYVQCFNGDKGKIVWTDGHRFKLNQEHNFLHRINMLSKMDIQFYRELDSNEKLAFKWWNKLSLDKQTSLYKEYFGANRLVVFPDEIEKIWKDKLQEDSSSFEYRIMDDGSNYNEVFKYAENRPINQKQFTTFDYDRFKSYINKFSNEDKGKIFRLMFNLCPDVNKHQEGFSDEFYTIVCQAFNAGKQSILNQKDGKEFQSSDSYYLNNFGQQTIL